MAPKTTRPTRGEVRTAHDQSIFRKVIPVAGVIAIAVSFPQIRWTYLTWVGVPEWAAPLVGVLVDVLAVVFAAIAGSVTHRAFHQRLYAWAMLAFFVAVSIFCNWLHAYSHSQTDGQVGAELQPVLPTDMTDFKPWIILVLAAIPPLGATIGMHGFTVIARIAVDADWREDGKRLVDDPSVRVSWARRAVRRAAGARPVRWVFARAGVDLDTRAQIEARERAEAEARARAERERRERERREGEDTRGRDRKKDTRAPAGPRPEYQLARATYFRLRDEAQGAKVDAARVRREAGLDGKVNPATVRTWCNSGTSTLASFADQYGLERGLAGASNGKANGSADTPGRILDELAEAGEEQVA